MKKSILISALALAAVATTSCSNEETKAIEPQSNAIEFGTYLGRDAISRGSVFTTDAMKTAGFGVFAAYTGQNDFASQPMNFMSNQQVTYDTDAWTYSPLKYWPNNPGDKVSFFAYAPHNVTGATPGTTAATVDFIVQDAVADQKDLVVADALTDNLKPSISDKVTFDFKHVLARIGLNVEAMFDKVNSDATGNDDNSTANGTKAGETTIRVTNVQLIGAFDKDGVIDLTNSTWNLGTPNNATYYEWTSTNFEAVANDVTVDKTQLNKADSYAMIIPQVMTGITIKVTYDVITTDGNLSGGNSTITNVITSAPFNFTFEKGKAYMFNLHLGMTSVKFFATVSDWENATNETVVNLPINTNN